jgi:hypothetical protein
MRHFIVYVFIGIASVFVLSSCASRIVDYSYPQSGSTTNASIVAYNVKGRWYPWGKTFHLGFGLGGNGYEDLLTSDNNRSRTFFAFSPELGWRIDGGKPGGGFADLGVKAPMPFGGDVGDIIFAPYILFGGAF